MVWFIIRDNIIYNWIIESEFLNGFMEIGCLKLFEEMNQIYVFEPIWFSILSFLIKL